MAFAADIDIRLAAGNSGALGCAEIARLLGRVFFSAVAAGVASSSAGGVCSATGVGFGLGVSAEISRLGFDVRFFGPGVGVASTGCDCSGSVADVASCACANRDPANAIPMHRTERRIPLRKHIKKTSAASLTPQSAFRNSQSCLPWLACVSRRSRTQTEASCLEMKGAALNASMIQRFNDPVCHLPCSGFRLLILNFFLLKSRFILQPSYL